MDWLERIVRTIYVHLIVPFLQTHDTLPRVAMGTGIGVFVGLTPTVGLQMYLVTMAWLLCRFVFRLRFNLPISVAMVWISNPVTMVPLYYLFLVTGQGVQSLLGADVLPMTFDAFQQGIAARTQLESVGWTHWFLLAGQVFIVEYGWPMVLGSLVYALPLGVVSYPIAFGALHRYRRRLAEGEGLTYEEWRRRYESKH